MWLITEEGEGWAGSGETGEGGRLAQEAEWRTERATRTDSHSVAAQHRLNIKGPGRRESSKFKVSSRMRSFATLFVGVSRRRRLCFLVQRISVSEPLHDSSPSIHLHR